MKHVLKNSVIAIKIYPKIKYFIVFTIHFDFFPSLAVH